MIDSGNRREFETGAVRDIQDGKGRCDLMPLDVISGFISPEGPGSDFVIDKICMFIETGARSWLQMALRKFAEENYDGEAETMFLDVAVHFEDGAKKYGIDNWKKGLPVSCYIDSAVRHYFKLLRGDQDEQHDRAFVWNLVCCLWTIEHKPEMIDLPRGI